MRRFRLPRLLPPNPSWRDIDRMMNMTGVVVTLSMGSVIYTSVGPTLALLSGDLTFANGLATFSLAVMIAAIISLKSMTRLPWRHLWAAWFGHTMVADVAQFEGLSYQHMLIALSGAPEPGDEHLVRDLRGWQAEIEDWCKVSLRGPWTNLPRLGWNYYRIMLKKDAALFRMRFQ